MTEENILGEKMKYYVWGIVEAYTGTNDIYFGQLTRKAVITMVIWMSQEFDEAYLRAQQILQKSKNRGDSV